MLYRSSLQSAQCEAVSASNNRYVIADRAARKLTEYNNTPECWEIDPLTHCDHCTIAHVSSSDIYSDPADPRASEWFHDSWCTLCGKNLLLASVTESGGMTRTLWFPCECVRELVVTSNASKALYCMMMCRTRDCYENDCYELSTTEPLTREIWSELSEEKRRYAARLIHSPGRLGWRQVSTAVVGHPDPVLAFRVMCTGVLGIFDAVQQCKFYGMLKPIGYREHTQIYQEILDELLWVVGGKMLNKECFRFCAENAADKARELYDNYQSVCVNRELCLLQIDGTTQLTPTDAAETRRVFSRVMSTLKSRWLYRACMADYAIVKFRRVHREFVKTIVATAKLHNVRHKFIKLYKALNSRRNLLMSLVRRRKKLVLHELNISYRWITWKMMMQKIPHAASSMAEKKVNLQHLLVVRQISRYGKTTQPLDTKQYWYDAMLQIGQSLL